MLGLHFVSTGKLPIKIGKILERCLKRSIVETMMILRTATKN